MSTVASGSLRAGAADRGAAGLVSFLSPCVLPLVPGYLSYVTGMTGADLPSARRGRMLAGRVAVRARLHRGVRASAGRSSAGFGARCCGTSRRHHAGARRAHDRARPGLHGLVPRPAARRPHPPAARRGSGRRAAARHAVRARLDALHRPDARRSCYALGLTEAQRRRAARCCRSRTASGLGLPFLLAGAGLPQGAGHVRLASAPLTSVVMRIGGGDARRDRRPAGHRRCGRTSSSRCRAGSAASAGDLMTSAERD